MIYYINTEEIIQSLPSLFSKIKTIGEFVYLNNNIYINTSANKQRLIKQLNSLITKHEQIMIVEINKNNLFKYPENVQSWIKNIFIKQEIKRFESEQQEKLKQFNKFIDDYELELEKQKQEQLNNDVNSNSQIESG